MLLIQLILFVNVLFETNTIATLAEIQSIKKKTIKVADRQTGRAR